MSEQFIGGLLVLVILALVLTQVVDRLLPIGAGFAWSGELARFSLVWCTFAMAGYLMSRDEHISVQLIDHVAKGGVLRAIKAFANLVVAAISLAFMVEAYQLVIDLSGRSTPALRIPLPLVFVVPLVGFGLTALRAMLGIFVTVEPRANTSEAAADATPQGRMP